MAATELSKSIGNPSALAHSLLLGAAASICRHSGWANTGEEETSTSQLVIKIWPQSSSYASRHNGSVRWRKSNERLVIMVRTWNMQRHITQAMTLLDVATTSGKHWFLQWGMKHHAPVRRTTLLNAALPHGCVKHSCVFSGGSFSWYSSSYYSDEFRANVFFHKKRTDVSFVITIPAHWL